MVSTTGFVVSTTPRQTSWFRLRPARLRGFGYALPDFVASTTGFGVSATPYQSSWFRLRGFVVSATPLLWKTPEIFNVVSATRIRGFDYKDSWFRLRRFVVSTTPVDKCVSLFICLHTLFGGVTILTVVNLVNTRSEPLEPVPNAAPKGCGAPYGRNILREGRG